ncbi:MAG TPA: hypothetical protein VLU25_01465 [Acidobacteriota bacterium]|nr:hypothetical protein [Acidobacteriota bacterium]
MKRPIWILTILLAGGPFVGTLAAAPSQGLSASAHYSSSRSGDSFHGDRRRTLNRRNRYRNRHNRRGSYYRYRGRSFSRGLRRNLPHKLRRLHRSKRHYRHRLKRHRHCRPHHY